MFFVIQYFKTVLSLTILIWVLHWTGLMPVATKWMMEQAMKANQRGLYSTVKLNHMLVGKTD